MDLEEKKRWVAFNVFEGIGPARFKLLLDYFGSAKKAFDAPEKELREIGLGEIVICLREVKKNAKRFSLIFEKELARVLIHGILHLLGYNHEKSEKEAEKMRKKEEYYLKLLFTNH